MADQSGGLAMMREYMKGNWTIHETMVLIEAKKMDDERRMRRFIGLPAPEQQKDSPSSSSNKPTELRWKSIEDYCWKKGCMRSQNQCNDKWDNLMRDYKKVREYERQRVESSSYWKMEKSERKERNLPTNMLPQIYQPLFEVVENKTISSSTAATALNAAVAAIESGNGSGGGQKHQIIQPAVILPRTSLLPQPPPPPQQLLLPPPPPQPILPTATDTSHVKPKRRRKMPTRTASPSGEGNAVEEEEAGSSKRDEDTEVAFALSRSALVIANAIKEREEREDERHNEVMSLKERGLKIKESNVEMNRQSMNGLKEAITKLASSILALASSSSRHNNQHQGGPP